MKVYFIISCLWGIEDTFLNIIYNIAQNQSFVQKEIRVKIQTSHLGPTQYFLGLLAINTYIITIIILLFNIASFFI